MQVVSKQNLKDQVAFERVYGPSIAHGDCKRSWEMAQILRWSLRNRLDDVWRLSDCDRAVDVACRRDIHVLYTAGGQAFLLRESATHEN